MWHLFSHNGIVTIKDTNKTIAQSYQEVNLYYLQLHSQTPIEDNIKSIPNLIFESCYTFKANKSVPMDTYQLWHLCLGHLGLNNLLKILKLVHGMENVDLIPPSSSLICEGCMYGRQCCKPFTESNTPRDLVELVHSNLIGPI